MSIPDSPGARKGYGSRFEGFPDLMSHRVQDVLLVSSLYDSFILAEDGRLQEAVLSEYLDLNLRHAPGLTRVTSGERALELARDQPRFNLILSSLHLGDMSVLELARRAHEARLDIPIVLLGYDNRELNDFLGTRDTSLLAGAFLWQGDARILLAMVKLIEDRLNLEHDVGRVGVPALIVVEDNVRYYSSFLPVMYAELMNHAQNLIPEGLNIAHKMMRIRARPKILLCTDYEEAWDLFRRYSGDILGVISDIEFPREGDLDRTAGVRLAREIRRIQPDVAIMLQSSLPENERLAEEAGAGFLLKGSPLLLHQLRDFLIDGFGFGDFVFRLPDGTEVDRASTLRDLARRIETVPDESLRFHGGANHFSRWLKLRTEFALAERIRPEKVTDFPDLASLRNYLVRAIDEYRRQRNRGVVADFDAETYDASTPFARIGGGSLGGKARGLAFVNFLLGEYEALQEFENVEISVPATVVLGTDVYDEFLEANGLRDFAIRSMDEDAIVRRFLDAPFPERHEHDLRAYLAATPVPIAVRSSGLLEDSAYQPFAGVYETFMLPNSHPDLDVRLRQLTDAIKRVYVSTFAAAAKSYVQATPYRLEEEKMAVVLQRLVGSRRGNRFYPTFSGVCRSHNFYPTPPLQSDDGVAVVAVGLGRTVVDGERALRFCPRYPRHVVQFSNVKDLLAGSQRTFWALELDDEDVPDDAPRIREVRLDLDVADRDGVLPLVASTYSHENRAVYDGVARDGTRVVTFAPILKHGRFPLAEILEYLMTIGEEGTSCPVEMEFAVDVPDGPDARAQFAFLQLRPLALTRELEELEIEEVPEEDALCRSDTVLGHGRIDSIRDVVVVDYYRFQRARSRETAREVGRFNAELSEQGRPYLLVGVGRWGSTDPWLGIPVTWDQISGVAVIVESAFRDLAVDPSQGTHFFQNLTSCNVGYFTVGSKFRESNRLDWDWLASRPAIAERDAVRHLRFDEPLTVLMNGRTGEGMILKPGVATSSPGAEGQHDDPRDGQ